MGYPDVVEEYATLDLVLAGKSIARYGDGEFNLVRGGSCISQRPAPGLQGELGRILKLEDPRLLVAIPRLDIRSPKYVNWSKYRDVYPRYLNPKKTYYSAFITRPDSAPWIATKEYFDKIEALWSGQDVIMVYGSDRSLSATFPALASATSVTVVPTDYAHTYHRIDRIMKEIIALPMRRVLLMCGPTATCLAHRLVEHGRHAIDLGHIGMWWRAYDNPKLQKHLHYRP